VRPKPVTWHASLIVQVSRWANGIVFGSRASEVDGVNCDCPPPSFSRRLLFINSPARTTRDRPRVGRAINNVNASIRGLSRTAARISSRSKTSGHQRRLQIFFTIGCEETPHDGGLSYAFDDTFSAELWLLPQSLTARSAEADREGGTTRVWPNRGTTRGQICPKAEYSVRKEPRFPPSLNRAEGLCRSGPITPSG